MVSVYRTIENQIGLIGFEQSGAEYETTLTNATSGALTQVGPYQLYNNITGEIVQLGFQGPTDINVLNSGHVEIATSVGIARINAYRRDLGIYNPDEPLPIGGKVTQTQINGTVNISIGGQHVTDFTVDNAPVGVLGGRVYAYMQENGEWGFESKAGTNFATLAELQAAIGPNVRYATPLEAQEYAIKGYLIKAKPGEVEKVALEMGGGIPPGFATKFSAALEYMFEEATAQLKYQVVSKIRIE